VIQDLTVDIETRSARVVGQVTDPVARVNPGAQPTVNIGQNEVRLTAAGDGVFRFDESLIPLPLETTHLVVRAENATGALGLAGRIVSFENGEGGAVTAVVEEDGLGAAGSVAQPYRVRVWGPKLAPNLLTAEVKGVHSRNLGAEPVALTFTADATQAGREGGIHAYASQRLLPATLPRFSYSEATPPSTLPAAPVVPVEIGGLVDVKVAVGEAGTLQRGTEVSGLEIVTPREASIINAAQMLLPDESGVSLPVTLKWHGIKGALELIETVPGLDITSYQAVLSGAFALAPPDSISVSSAIAANGEEVILAATAQDAEGVGHLSETAFYTFTPFTAENPTPFATSPGNWVRFKDSEGVWLRNGVFLLPGVIDGLELLYPSGWSDLEISDHLRENGVRPIGIRRNGGTLVGVTRADGKDVFEKLDMPDSLFVQGRPPTPMPEQVIDGDDVTWQDVLDLRLDFEWESSYFLAELYGVRKRSEIIQRIRKARGLPASDGGMSREYRDLRARATNAFWGDIKDAFFLAISGFLTGGWALVFGVIEAADGVYNLVAVDETGREVLTVAVPAAVVFRPDTETPVFHAIDAQAARYQNLLKDYLKAQREKGDRRFSRTSRSAAAHKMVEASAKLGEAAAKDYAERVLKLDPKTRVCCDPPMTGGGATGKFDDVYVVGEKFHIFEAKGGQRYASLLYGLSGRRIGNNYALQGTKQYIKSVAQALAESDSPAARAMAEDMLQAIADGEWHRFQHYFVAARWKSDRAIRIGRGLGKAVAPFIKVTKSILF